MDDSRLRKNAQLRQEGTELYFVSYLCTSTGQWVRQMWCTGPEMISLVQHATAKHCSHICVNSETTLDEIIDWDIEDNDRPITLREYQYGAKYQEMHEYFSNTFEQEFSERRAVPI